MLVAAIGSITVFSIADRNPMYFVLGVLGVMLSWELSVRPNRPAPRMVINTILLLVVVIAGIEMLRVGVGVSSFAVFAALLLVVKMLDLRAARDDGQILMLSLTILISGVLTSNTLLTGVMMVIAMMLIMRAVVLFQIYAVAQSTNIERKPLSAKARIDVRSMLLATGFLCALIGTIIFIVIPRNIGASAFGQWGPSGRSVSGFSDTVELGRPGFISQSSTPVLDLTITDRDGLNIGSENTPAVYLRGAVLGDYDDGVWKRSPVMQSPLRKRTHLVGPNTSLTPNGGFDRSAWDQQFSITMRTSNSGPVYLFAPWKTVELRVGSEPMRIGFDFERGIFIKDGIGGRIGYAVRSMNTDFDEIDYTKFEQRDPAISAPIAPKIKQLASDIVERAGIEPSPEKRSIRDDLGAVRAMETYLRSRYTYSLDAQPVPRGEDATQWFLFDRKSGHCEYYASSLALMSRSLGIPARVLTGYICSDYNTVTGQYVVRESNAHAWIEAEIAPGEWRTFDGTPRADFHAIHEPDPSIWRSIGEMYESVEFLWVQTVVGYDSNARQSIMGSASTDFGLSRLGESLLNRFAAGRGRLLARGATIGAIVFAFSMFVGIIILRYNQIIGGILDWIRERLGRMQSRLFQSTGSDLDPRYTQLESGVHRILMRLGVFKPPSVPLKSHIHNHILVLDGLAKPTRDAILEASELIYRYRFSSAPQSIDPDQLARVSMALRASEKSITKKHPPTSTHRGHTP